MSLQRRLDSLIADFTREILEVIGRANLSEIAPRFAKAKLAQAKQEKLAQAKVAKKEKRAAAKPVRAPKAAPKQLGLGFEPKEPKERKAAEPKRAAAKPAPKAVQKPAPAAPVVEAAPDARTLERMILGALRGAAPMNREDVLDSAGVGSDHLESARKVLDGLVERGIIGTANLSGSPLLFIKPAQTKRRARKEKPAPVVVAAAPQPEWKPTVIRRKKTTAEETAPANDGNTSS